MKKIIVLMLVAIIFASCSTVTRTASRKSNIDPALVGSWYGWERDNEKPGLEKHWVQNRTADGRFVLLFLNYEDGEIYSTARKGVWWVDDGVFYETFDITGSTDSYEYLMITANMIRFKARKLSVPGVNPEYTFIETRVEEL